jgi:hypothetical protein
MSPWENVGQGGTIIVSFFARIMKGKRKVVAVIN